MEKYLLETILEWKVNCVTPYEYIKTICEKILKKFDKLKIAEKALDISNFEFLSIFVFNNIAYDALNVYNPYCIAFASILESMKLLGVETKSIMDLIIKTELVIYI